MSARPRMTKENRALLCRREQMIDEAVWRVFGPKVIRLVCGYVREHGLGDAVLITEDDDRIPLIRAEFCRIMV